MKSGMVTVCLADCWQIIMTAIKGIQFIQPCHLAFGLLAGLNVVGYFYMVFVETNVYL